MKDMKFYATPDPRPQTLFVLLFSFFSLLFSLFPLDASPLLSATWGFRLDLPEGYEYIEGNNRDRFSFKGPNGAMFDIVVYNGVYQDVEQMANDVTRRLGSEGETASFEYEGKTAVLLDLYFRSLAGWGLCLELAGNGKGGNPPLLCALAYSPSSGVDMDVYHISALDSIAPSDLEARRPGPISEFSYPRGEAVEFPVAFTDLGALFRENDAEAAQAVVDREFSLLRRYESADNWQQAWIRYYGAVYRDSWDRLSAAAFRLEREWNTGADTRAFSEKALAFVQGFIYERNLEGSDFINLVTAISEGRGDCDTRSMLLAILLEQADIPAAMMISQNHSHAMGLADVPGGGARFDTGGKKWLVAETTDKVGIGLISADKSDTASWLGVIFDIP
jgi:hypothetical protein